MDFNLGDLITRRADLSPDRVGFKGADYEYTFREANLRVNRLAGFLAGEGLKPGERLAILCKNNEHLALGLLAASKMGAVTTLLNWRLNPSELVYILNDCGAAALFYDSVFHPVVEAIKGQVPVRLFLHRGPVGLGTELDQALAKAPAGSGEAEPLRASGGEDPAVIMYTSGTTGRPKGAVLSHHCLLWGTIAIMNTILWETNHRFLLVAPLFHIGGLAPLLTNLHRGTLTWFMPDFDPVEVWRVIAAEKITSMMTVPLMLQALAMVAKKMPVDPSSLAQVTCGASAVPAGLIRAYADMGIEVNQVYGITEYSGAVTFWTRDMGLANCHTQGRPVFHGRLAIHSPQDGGELPRGQVGEIWIGGPMVFSGYWNNPEATAAALIGGWYRTGDMGRINEQGFVEVVDRLKDMIISGGENIYPAELEAVIQGHPGVAEVAVVGRPNPQWGEIPVAFVVPRPGVSLEPDEVISLCRERLASFKCVKEVRLVEALPKNPVGKILKKELRAGLA